MNDRRRNLKDAAKRQSLFGSIRINVFSSGDVTRHAGVPELGVAVADDLHGKGLGTAVVCVLVGLAKALGKSGVELTTMKGNDAAFRCYQRCGFEEQVRFF